MAIVEKSGTPFDVHVDKGDVTGKCWDGAFRAKLVLSFMDQIRVDRIKRDLLGPGPYDGADSEAVAMASILADIQVRLTDAPTWWEGGANHSDTNLLMEVYRGAKKVAQDHIDQMTKEGEKAQEKLRKAKE